MPRFTYLGPFDSVDVLVEVPKGAEVDVPDVTAARLLDQPEVWAPDGKALDTLTVPELEARALRLGVEVPSGAKKAEIVKAVLAYDPNPRITTEEG